MSSGEKSQQPVALVTGAAGGIGSSISTRLAERGYLVAMADINTSGLKALQSKLGFEQMVYPVDVTDYGQVLRMVEDLAAKTGRIDVLVNNAGMVITEPYEECSIDKLCSENALNYLAPLYCIKAVLPYMQEAGKGCIVSICSIASIMPLSASPGYSASKAALRSLSLSLNLHLKDYGIHVGCVCPSAVDTRSLLTEALEGGSVLNFLHEPLTTDIVAQAVLKVIDKKKMEVCIPFHEGLSSKLGGFFPSILPAILPRLEKAGERNRLKFLAKKNLQPVPDREGGPDERLQRN